MASFVVGVNTGVVVRKGLYDIVTMPVGVVTLLRFTHRHPGLIDQARSGLGAAA